jgi:hypothetical protein
MNYMGNVPKIPLGVRRNNPGNIDFNPACIWEGLVMPHDGHRFCYFKAPEYGIRAMGKLISNYYNLKRHTDGSKIDTIEKVIHRWAPPHENHTNIYAKFVAERCGVVYTDKIVLTEPVMLVKLVKSIIRFENGYEPYSDEIIRRGIALLKPPSASHPRSPVIA